MSVASYPPEFETATFAKVSRRLIPFLFLCYIVAFLDRVNVGFAKLQMASDLQFSDTVYSVGAGIFFIGYFIFEVPSNVILERVGARIWIARIMITWGIISSAMMFTHEIPWGPIAPLFGLTDSEFTFYFLRFMLGVAEAGFFPGIILYLTYWFPSEMRARKVALFMTAIAIANVIGSPVSGGIMQFMDGVHGLARLAVAVPPGGHPLGAHRRPGVLAPAQRAAPAPWLTDRRAGPGHQTSRGRRCRQERPRPAAQPARRVRRSARLGALAGVLLRRGRASTRSPSGCPPSCRSWASTRRTSQGRPGQHDSLGHRGRGDGGQRDTTPTDRRTPLAFGRRSAGCPGRPVALSIGGHEPHHRHRRAHAGHLGDPVVGRVLLVPAHGVPVRNRRCCRNRVDQLGGQPWRLLRVRWRSAGFATTTSPPRWPFIRSRPCALLGAVIILFLRGTQRKCPGACPPAGEAE